MSARNAVERTEFENVIMGEEGGTRQLAARLVRAATTLQRLSERDCNVEHRPTVRCPERLKDWEPGGYCRYCGTLTERGHGRIPADTITEERTEARVRRILPPGWEADFNGDCRGGAVLKVKLPSGRWNDFGGPPLYCVPTTRTGYEVEA